MKSVGTVIVTAAVLYLLIGGGMQPTSTPKLVRSLDPLVPSFRAKLLVLLARMRAEGLRPIVWETYRSPERARQLAEEGTGIAHSQHTLGLAADIVDESLRWNAPPRFWDALHRITLELGMGRVQRRDKKGNLVWDLPHVQALPGKYDSRMRLLGELEREEFLRTRYA